VVPEFSLTARHVPDVHLVALHGELDIVSADWLTDALVEVAGSTVVVDLSDLTFMDCSGIDALVAAKNRIVAQGLGQLVLARPGALARRALDVLGLGALIVEWSPDWG
jgi:stage II sporulation protein AA (anti-sigma F factor antagonist)